jgi:DNA-binding HxlR family transcriptional regulator
MEEIRTAKSCKQARLAIQDTLDVVGGKWKLVLISVLRDYPRKFKSSLGKYILALEFYRKNYRN